jgi:hypothetical protein
MTAMLHVKKTVFVMTLVMMYAHQGLAKPVVIFDNGKTQPLTAYLPAVKLPGQNAFPASTTATIFNADRLQVLAHNLPVSTPELTPGKVLPQSRVDPLSGAASVYYRRGYVVITVVTTPP